MLKKLTFAHCIAFAPLTNICRLYLSGSVSGMSILFHQSSCPSFHFTLLITVNLEGNVLVSILFRRASQVALVSHAAQLVKNLPATREILVRFLGSIPGLGRSPGEGKGYALQYSGLENSMDCIVPGVSKSRRRLSDFHFTSLPGGASDK